MFDDWHGFGDELVLPKFWGGQSVRDGFKGRKKTHGFGLHKHDTWVCHLDISSNEYLVQNFGGVQTTTILSLG